MVEWWLRVREVPGSIPSQGPRHTEDVIKMVPLVPLSTEREIITGSFSIQIELRNIFEVGGHWSLSRGWKKRMTTQNLQRRTLNVFNKK